MNRLAAPRVLVLLMLVPVLALATPLTPMEAQDLRPVSHANEPPANAPSVTVRAPVALQVASYSSLRPDSASAPSRAPGPRCPSVGRAALGALTAVGMLVLPTAVIAGRMANDDWRGARWATYAGSAYSVGMTAYLMSGRTCTSTDALGYMWAPFAAAAGAFIGTR